MYFDLLDFFRSTSYEIKNFPEFRKRFRCRSIKTLRLDYFQIFKFQDQTRGLGGNFTELKKIFN